MIPFNIPPCTGKEEGYIAQVVASRKICGDGEFTKRCSQYLETLTGSSKVLLTTSGTHALDLSAILTDVGAGDEVIMPSYTFSSTANAFALRGATVVFVDIRPDTMNLDEKLIEDAVTPRTKVIVSVHYAGVACEMDVINDVAKRHNLFVVEDAAQAAGSTYKGRCCGNLCDIGCYSFHETKNYSMGEGGALLTSNTGFAERAEIIREKGTDRSRFFRGQVDKYSWVDMGSSFLPSELNAAYLYAQLMEFGTIMQARLDAWEYYHSELGELEKQGRLELPKIPSDCKHNGHMYYVKAKDLTERTALIAHLKENGITAPFHYIPLHSAEAGRKFGRFYGVDKHTTSESERLLRLPMFYGLPRADAAKVIEVIYEFYKQG